MDRQHSTTATLIITLLVSALLAFPAGASAATILARQYVTSTVHIPGGHYATPYIITTPDTEYVLDGDITADGTAIAIRASRVVLNLNGKTVTYNQTVPGEGVTIDSYNKTDIAITNGRIIQGMAMSEGDQYGAGNNPVKSIGVSRLQLADISARYGGRDVAGFYVMYATYSLIENNTLEDTWKVGTFKNRHQGIDAIKLVSPFNVVRNNTIINCRQRGVQVGDDSEVYGNNISINSLATNSVGISGYAVERVKVYNNAVTGRGEHPIGIGFGSSGTNNIEVFGNTIEVQTTRIGEEYGGSAACFNPVTPCGNYAVGFRTTWGGNNIHFHDNTIVVRSDSRYQGTYSPTGQSVIVNGKGRGLMVAVNAGESSKFVNNAITALDKDGTGKAFGIACTGGNVGEMIFSNNTVTSNILNVAVSDEYGACAGYPIFSNNSFIKADNYPAYRTVAAELGGYSEATGRFVSNMYLGGASQESINLNLSSTKPKSVYFGREVTATLQNSPSLTPISGAALTIQNGGAPFDSTATTAADGTAKVIVYDYELHNGGGTLPAGATRYIGPHTIQAAIASTTYLSPSDGTSFSWDSLTGSGTYYPPVYTATTPQMLDMSKKLTVALGSSSAPVVIDTTPPAMYGGAPTGVFLAASGAATLSMSTNEPAVCRYSTQAGTAFDSMMVFDVTGGVSHSEALSGLVAGVAYTYYVKCQDNAGNITGTDLQVAFTVQSLDAVKPVLTITAPTNGKTVSNTVTVSATASDNVGVQKVELYVNGVLKATDTTAPYSFTWNSATVANGSCVLTLKAYDAAGNVTTGSVTVTVSNIVKGDVDGDGLVTLNDARMVYRAAYDPTQMTKTIQLYGDVFPYDSVTLQPVGNGKVDVSDALLLVRKSVGLVNW